MLKIAVAAVFAGATFIVAPLPDGSGPSSVVDDQVVSRASLPEEKPPAWVHPLPNAITTSCYGNRSGAWHAGVDLARPYGTPVVSVGYGTVVSSGWMGNYGRQVTVNHGGSHSGGTKTRYAHLSKTVVSKGDKVRAGDVIGNEGNSGRSSGPHLHLEVITGHSNTEPTSWLAKRDVSIEGC